MNVHIDQDLADVLSEQFNSYAAYMEDLEELSSEFVLEALRKYFDPEDVKFLIEDDFGRGVLMGCLHTLYQISATRDSEDNG